MERTTPTFAQLIEEAIQRWQKFRRVLYRPDQEHFDRMMRNVRQLSRTGTYQCAEDPFHAILLAIALDHERRILALEENQLHQGLPSD